MTLQAKIALARSNGHLIRIWWVRQRHRCRAVSLGNAC